MLLKPLTKCKLCYKWCNGYLDWLKSVFSLKMRLVLISSSAIANHDVVITITDGVIFSSRAYALISRGSRLHSRLTCLGFACSNLAKKNKRLLAVYRGTEFSVLALQEMERAERYLSSPPLPALLLVPFFTRALTLVPRSLHRNRTETLVTQAMYL